MWHLKRGGSQHSLYRANPPVVSQRTAHKIKALMDAGALDFLMERFISNMSKYNQKDIYQTVEGDGEHKKSSASAFIGEDGFRLYTLAIVKEAEESVSQGFWCVEGLEEAGIPRDKLISILSEYDVLQERRRKAEISSDYAGTYVLYFDGIDRYIELNYIVIFSLRYHKAPFSYIEYAASLYARGLLDLDDSLRISGENMLRYAIWMGCEYREAYLQSLDGFHKTNASKKRFRSWVNSIVHGVYTNSVQQYEDEIEAEIMRHMEDHRDDK